MHLHISGRGSACAGLLMSPAPASMSVQAVAHDSQWFVGSRNLLHLRKAEIYLHGKVWATIMDRTTVIHVKSSAALALTQDARNHAQVCSSVWSM